MSEETQNVRPSISSVDARVGRLEDAQSRLEARQLEQDGVMRLIQLEQQHIREIMTSRFVSLEQQLHANGSKLDAFMGKMEALIERGMEQQSDLKASALGRQIDERLQKVEAWEDISRSFHSEVRGMAGILRVMFGGTAVALLVAVLSALQAFGVLS